MTNYVRHRELTTFIYTINKSKQKPIRNLLLPTRDDGGPSKIPFLLSRAPAAQRRGVDNSELL